MRYDGNFIRGQVLLFSKRECMNFEIQTQLFRVGFYSFMRVDVLATMRTILRASRF